MGDLPRIEAYIWGCGDEECSCTEPVIERWKSNPRVPGAVLRERLWTGTFHSGATREELAEQERELAEARKQFDVE